MLTRKQIQAFKEEGYLAVENVLTAGELGELQRITDEFVDASRKVARNDDTFDLEPGHSAESPSLRRIKHPLSKHPGYTAFARHERILDIVACLLGPNLRFHNNKINMKNPGDGSAVEWHQDWAFYPHTNDDLLEVGIALSDMTEETAHCWWFPAATKARRGIIIKTGASSAASPTRRSARTAPCR